MIVHRSDYNMVYGGGAGRYAALELARHPDPVVRSSAFPHLCPGYEWLSLRAAEIRYVARLPAT